MQELLKGIDLDKDAAELKEELKINDETVRALMEKIGEL